VIMYDITSETAFNSLEVWIGEVRLINPKNMTVALVGTKKDRESDRKISTKQGQAVASKHDFLFFEISSKENENIEELFTELTKKMIQKSQPK